MHLQDKISQLRLVRCDESGDKFSWPVKVIRIMLQFNEERVRVLDLVVEGSLVRYSPDSLRHSERHYIILCTYPLLSTGSTQDDDPTRLKNC